MMSFPLRSAFIALPLEGDTLSQYQDLQKRLEPFADCLTFQNPETPHLTLYFWRELLKIEYEQMIPQAEKIAEQTQAFSLTINGVDTFGKAGDERVLFFTVAFSPELATLKKKFPWPNPPDQPFHPHITLARIKHAQRFAVHRKKILKELDGLEIPFPVAKICFYATIDGEKQTPVRDFVLS